MQIQEQFGELALYRELDLRIRKHPKPHSRVYALTVHSSLLLRGAQPSPGA